MADDGLGTNREAAAPSKLGGSVETDPCTYLFVTTDAAKLCVYVCVLCAVCEGVSRYDGYHHHLTCPRCVVYDASPPVPSPPPRDIRQQGNRGGGAGVCVNGDEASASTTH